MTSVRIIYKGEPRCPHAMCKGDTDFCDINDKCCLLESDDSCNHYNEYLEIEDDG